MNRWFVVVAKQNQDFLAARGLREQDYPDVYLPKTYERWRTKNHVVTKAALLLPRIVFVLFDAAKKQHGPIAHTRGVRELLCDKAGNPRAIREGERLISRMRQAEDDELCAASETAKSGRTDLRRGMRVRIDKPGLLTRDEFGDAVQLEGHIVVFDRRKVEVLCGTLTWIVPDVDVSVVT